MPVEQPPREERKIIVRLPQPVFLELDRLARVPSGDQQLVYASGTSAGVARYAEIARVLVIGELLTNAPQATRVAAAVLSNATLILAAAFARLTYRLQEDLADVAATTSRADRDVLEGVRAGTGKGPNQRKPEKARAPILNLTLDGWMHRSVLRVAAGVPDEDVREAGLRSKLSYTVIRLLEMATERRDTEALILDYAKAVLRVRRTLEEAVASEQATIQGYLQRVRPLR